MEKAKSLGYINILASNKAGSLLRNEAHMLNVDMYFDRIIGAEDTSCDKPSKSFTDSAVAGFDAENIISIGDGKADIQMGRNYITGVSLLVWSNPDSLEFVENKPDASFSNLQDLVVYLENFMV